MLNLIMLINFFGGEAEASPFNGLRVGVCGGLDTECPGVAVKLEAADPTFAISANFSEDMASAQARFYISPQNQYIRPNLTLGYATSLNDGEDLAIYGPGLGLDIHMGSQKSFILRPHMSFSSYETEDQDLLLYGASLSFIWTGELKTQTRSKRPRRHRRHR